MFEKSLFRSLAALTAVGLLASTAQAVTIECVPAGDPRNAADDTGYGAVGCAYQIGECEVTNAEYAEFLNNVAASADPHGLYNTYMGSAYGGITRSGGAGNYTYSTIAGRGNMPVNCVSFWDACRFANWLHNGQGSGDTETGAYTLTPQDIANNTVIRNDGWQWAVTSEDEWYKAAYYDGSGGYYDYPTRSNTAPMAEGPPGTNKTNGSANYDDVVGHLTDVGAYAYKPSSSAYGTFDQGGNACEWNEAIMLSSYRGLRGGSYSGGDDDLHALGRGGLGASEEYFHVGFRVVMIPEPTTAVLGIVGIMCGLWWWKKAAS